VSNIYIIHIICRVCKSPVAVAYFYHFLVHVVILRLIATFNCAINRD